MVVGYEDPDLETLGTSSPTMSRRSRQLIMSYSSLKLWRLIKGDVKAAFLQGTSSEVDRKVYCWPVPELAQALDQSPLTPVQLAKAAYGLVNAPSEWHKTDYYRFFFNINHLHGNSAQSTPCSSVLGWQNLGPSVA